ncbi:RidA family protein [Paraburkholderia sp. Ac-20342]|uniref:RidA family protein n=1 Tax=unclassified Paraburkholderia TaxID=2615204 RepID=UPI001420DFFD|nr:MULTISPECIES: RidA family protein [unclassified Paraburkholderia]MBN3845848.1 RidA family protein [Paraburkholderia sp. Ac-20342]NIF77376.1 RidA family protein [Paraburkholderia sp. Cy-641]
MRPSALPAPRFRYTPVVRVGSLVFVSGLIGLDRMTGELATGGAAEETRQVLHNLLALCEAEKWSLRTLVFARVYCAGHESAAAVNDAWDEFFRNEPPPARSFVVVAGLPLGAAVEIEFQLVV